MYNERACRNRCALSVAGGMLQLVCPLSCRGKCPPVILDYILTRKISRVQSESFWIFNPKDFASLIGEFLGFQPERFRMCNRRVFEFSTRKIYDTYSVRQVCVPVLE